MDNKENFYNTVDQIYAADPRYKPDSYEFVIQALNFTQNRLKRNGHVASEELLGGIKDFAINLYGPMAKAVLNHWGIRKTQDFGNIVFNMIEKKLLSKTDQDAIEEFADIYDFDVVFSDKLRENIIKEVK